MKRTLLLFLVSLLGLSSGFAQQSTDARRAIVPALVKFSGIASDSSGKPFKGFAGITFAIYRDQEGGAPPWLETQSVALDKSGSYTVSLGITKAEGIPADIFTSGEAKWLGVQVEGQAEQPRVLLLSVPYAMKAADAETIGGLPPSAFVLAVPGSTPSAAVNAASLGSTASAAPPPATITGSGTANFLPLFTGAATIGNSALFQSGTGTSSKIGINTSTPAATLDVKGTTNVEGLLTLPATGAATSTGGKASQPQDLVASSFSSSTSAAVNQTFQWKAEAAGNNTATPSGTLNLLFGSGTTAPTETGLKLSSKGLFTFATGQTFPGAGTITGVTAGTGLTGGGTTGSVSLNLDTTKVPLLASANTFNAGQTVKGNLTLSGSGNGLVFADGSKQTTAASGGCGTVTSVALSAPSSDFTVTGSPTTKAGTLGLGWTVAPTSANAANAIVKRNSGGNFATNSVTASSLISSAVTATTITAGTLNVTSLNPSGTISVVTSNANAIVGNSSALNATTIYGRASASTGSGWRVAGVVDSSDGVAKGTYGVALANFGNTEGVNGVSLSGTGLGVVGQGGSNIFSSQATGNLGVWTIGVLGDTSLPNGIGVLGTTDNGYGVVGINNDSFYNAGLFMNNADGPVLAAVGYINGVYIDSNGNLEADGTITAAVKNFRIDHPARS
jgi:hypothetical protein